MPVTHRRARIVFALGWNLKPLNRRLGVDSRIAWRCSASIGMVQVEVRLLSCSNVAFRELAIQTVKETGKSHILLCHCKGNSSMKKPSVEGANISKTNFAVSPYRNSVRTEYLKCGRNGKFHDSLIEKDHHSNRKKLKRVSRPSTKLESYGSWLFLLRMKQSASWWFHEIHCPFVRWHFQMWVSLRSLSIAV